jgi:hypothetical protein
MKNMSVVKAYGKMWARNPDNIKAIPSGKGCCDGVYILFDGSMPVYVGKGTKNQKPPE